MDSIERLRNFVDQLPAAPERFAFYAGAFGVANSMINIEFGNPFLGGVQAVIGATTMLAACSTSRQVDNRGEL